MISYGAYGSTASLATSLRFQLKQRFTRSIQLLYVEIYVHVIIVWFALLVDIVIVAVIEQNNSLIYSFHIEPRFIR